MSIPDYATLQARLKDLLIRTDLEAEAPGFIGLAEAEMSRDLEDHWRLEKRHTLTLSARYVDLPLDWRGTGRVEIDVAGRVLELDLLSTASMANARRADNTPGTPRNYAHTGGQLEVYPTPDQSYSAELLYQGAITPLSDAAPTNWLLQQYPDAYLYGAAKHSAPWLRDDQRLSTWEALYRAAIDKVAERARVTKHSGTGLRMKFKSV